MQTLSIFSHKHLRVCYWDAERRLLDADKLNLEKRLSLLGDISFVELKSLDDENFSPCDLLIIAAQHIPEDEFSGWLAGLQKRIRQQGKIWSPALIFADVTFSILDESLVYAAKSNWYFDIVTADHLDSLPIRVANLLRIHDHLHELRRYSEELAEMEEKLEQLQKTSTGP